MFGAILPAIRLYWVPFLLFSIGLFFQFVILPNSFPPSHYDVLGVERYAPVEKVTEAYNKISSKWNSEVGPEDVKEFIKVRYAYELLTNSLWKRDYDLFNVDEHSHVIEKAISRYDGTRSSVALPLLDVFLPDSIDAFNELTSDEFMSKIRNETALLIQVYSVGSPRCIQFFSSWKGIAGSLNGVAEVAMVDVGEVNVVSHLASRKPNQQLFFPTGLPSIVAFPPNCRSADCLLRYEGSLSELEIVDWMATSVLGLPRILYYTKETLGPNFIAKTGRHKGKVIYFSDSGVRVAPFLRQAAKDYLAYASFASVLWREQDSSIWWNSFQVESAPAVVFLKDPGVKPVVYHGHLNTTFFSELMEQNKHMELPQLRSMNSMELGCDARGYSRAGNDTLTWYCLILVGRPSLELNKMRETMRSTQSLLANGPDYNVAVNHNLSLNLASAATVFGEKRLSLVWLDGETQKKYCLFYLRTENIYDTCGPRRYGDPTDMPRLFIVRYNRNSTESTLKVERKPKMIWNAFHEDDGQAYQLVAVYDGPEDVHKIIEWISKTVEDGDTKTLPDFIATTPELIPEDANPIWSKGARGAVSASSGVKNKLRSFFMKIYGSLTDPRLGPALLLGACLSFGTIWMQRSPSSHVPKEEEDEAYRMDRRRQRAAKTSSQGRPWSATDDEPKDAVQMLSSDSDS